MDYTLFIKIKYRLEQKLLNLSDLSVTFCLYIHVYQVYRHIYFPYLPYIFLICCFETYFDFIPVRSLDRYAHDVLYVVVPFKVI